MFCWEGNCVYHSGIVATTRRSVFILWCFSRFITLGLNHAGSECLGLKPVGVWYDQYHGLWRTVWGLSSVIYYLFLFLASFIKYRLCCKSSFQCGFRVVWAALVPTILCWNLHTFWAWSKIWSGQIRPNSGFRESLCCARRWPKYPQIASELTSSCSWTSCPTVLVA